MSSLAPVIVGMTAGIALVVMFALYFSEGIALSPIESSSRLSKIVASVGADCTDFSCAKDIVVDCNTNRSAVVQHDVDYVWIVQAKRNSDFCNLTLTDGDIRTVGNRFADFQRYDCNVPIEELASMKGSSFSKVLTKVNQDSGWRCGLSVP